MRTLSLKTKQEASKHEAIEHEEIKKKEQKMSDFNSWGSCMIYLKSLWQKQKEKKLLPRRPRCSHDNLRKKQTPFGMNGFLLNTDLQATKKKQVGNLIRKSESRKEPSVAFQVSLNKIEELEESRPNSFDQIRFKTETPKSANLFTGIDLFDTELRKGHKSWELISRDDSLININPVSSEKIRREVEKKLFEVKECHCWQKARSSSARSSYGFDSEARKSRTHVKWYSSDPQRKCKSNPDFSSKTFQECRKIFDRENDLLKVMRSLKLLGFNLSDFGIFSKTAETTPKWKRGPKSTTLTTKITKRSVSLDSLRMTVKKAWIDDCLDESHRRLLAQAAYEEWYFKKEEELWKKREAEKITRMAERENHRNDSQRKKKKSEEEFQKWLHRKRMKRKEDKESFIRKQENPFNRLMKNREESEKAFKNWKQTKNRELKKKKKEKQKEEEKRIESEKQNIEKKIIAEKAFHQWKAKLEKTEKLAKTEIQSKKKDEGRKKKKEGRQISFQMWKAAKDEQMKEEIKKIREANRRVRKERQIKLEERIYEAQQAFEDWLEKTDLRKQKKYPGVHADSQKIIPWIPA